MPRYGMVIDLFSCIGCNACTLACKMENATLPEIFWARVLEKEVGRYPSVRRIFLPVLCNHCENAICETVCPSGATTKRDDGIVTIDYDICIGCRACIEACPYGARFYLSEIKTYYPEGPTPYEKLFEGKYQKGVVQKCTFCLDRVEKGQDPTCVQVCPTSCRYFGDISDPNSTVSKLISEKKAFQLRPEKGTDPAVYYTE